LAIAIVIFIVVRRAKKRKNALEELNHTDGHSVAVQIKNELESRGCTVGDLDTSFDPNSNESVVGSFHVSDPYSGDISFCNYTLHFHEQLLQLSAAGGDHMYVIENKDIGLLVSSKVFLSSKDIPPLMEIAADVIKSSGYDFESRVI
jgi:hypothetical protein